MKNISSVRAFRIKTIKFYYFVKMRKSKNICLFVHSGLKRICYLFRILEKPEKLKSAIRVAAFKKKMYTN